LAKDPPAVQPTQGTASVLLVGWELAGAGAQRVRAWTPVVVGHWPNSLAWRTHTRRRASREQRGLSIVSARVTPLRSLHALRWVLFFKNEEPPDSLEISLQATGHKHLDPTIR
jgi:hypothetical protein